MLLHDSANEINLSGKVEGQDPPANRWRFY